MKISKIPLRRKWSRGQAVAAGKSIHVAAEVQSSGGRLFKDRAPDRVFSDKEGSAASEAFGSNPTGTKKFKARRRVGPAVVSPNTIGRRSHCRVPTACKSASNSLTMS